MNNKGPKITRGQFLKLTAAAGAALLVGVSPAAAVEPIARRPIPKGGEMLAVIGLGTSRVFGVEGTAEQMAARTDVLRRMFEAGASVIDTSPSYGNAEAITGRLLTQMGARNKAFIATKISTYGDRDEGLGHMRGSQKRLHTDRFDLMQVHNLKNTDTHLRSIRQWRDAGKIRYVGVTHYVSNAHEELARVLESEPLDFVQVNYSVLDRNAEKRLLPLAADRGVAVLINRPYMVGGLFRAVKGRPLPPWAAEFGAASWGQVFLKFILSHPAVTCIIPGTSKATHMTDNLGAARGPLPDAKQRQRIVQLMEEL